MPPLATRNGVPFLLFFFFSWKCTCKPFEFDDNIIITKSQNMKCFHDYITVSKTHISSMSTMARCRTMIRELTSDPQNTQRDHLQVLPSGGSSAYVGAAWRFSVLQWSWSSTQTKGAEQTGRCHRPFYVSIVYRWSNIGASDCIIALKDAEMSSLVCTVNHHLHHHHPAIPPPAPTPTPLLS